MSLERLSYSLLGTRTSRSKEFSVIVDEAMQRKMRHVPNAISWIRLILGLAMLWLLMVHPAWLYDPLMSGIAALVFAVVCATDWVDGFVARLFQVTSKFGAMLDTLVDKAVIGLPMTWLAVIGVLCDSYVLGWVLTVVTLLREVVITLGKPIAQRKGIELNVQESGRFKMAAQCIAVVLTIWSVTRGEVSLVMWGGAVLMSVFSMREYWLIFHQAREVEAV